MYFRINCTPKQFHLYRPRVGKRRIRFLKINAFKAGESGQYPQSCHLLGNQVHSVFKSKPYYGMRERVVDFKVLPWSFNFLECKGGKFRPTQPLFSKRQPNLSDDLIWAAKKSWFDLL